MDQDSTPETRETAVVRKGEDEALIRRRGLFAAAAAVVAAIVSRPKEVAATSGLGVDGNLVLGSNGTNNTANTAGDLTAIALSSGNFASTAIFVCNGQNGGGGTTANISGMNGFAKGFGNGVNGFSIDGIGVHGSHTNGAGTPLPATFYPGVLGETSSTLDYAAGVLGRVNSTAPAVISAGVAGFNNSTTGQGGGVFGFHAGTGPGVAGMGAGTTGVGVYGVAGNGGITGLPGVGFGIVGEVNGASSVAVYGITNGSSATGVRGDSGSGFGVYGTSTSSFGVYGISTSGVGTVGTSGTTYGVYGASTGPASNSFGVVGFSTNGGGVYGQSTNSHGVVGSTPVGFGVYGVTNNNVGVAGTAVSGIGVYGASTSGNAAVFVGPVTIVGSLQVTGAKNAIVPHPDGTRRRVYSLESPESFFEDFGEGEVIDGAAEVTLDVDFAAVVHCDGYRVFLTPEGDSQGLYVCDKTPTGFRVREQQGGTSRVPFTYRVVARRRDVALPRFDRVEVPPLPEARAFDEQDPAYADAPRVAREAALRVDPEQPGGPSLEPQRLALGVRSIGWGRPTVEA